MSLYDQALQEKNRKNYRKALELFSLCEEEQKSNPEFFFFRSYCFSRLKDYRSALQNIEKGLSLKPEKELHAYHSNRAINLLRLNRLDDAMQSIQTSIRMKPENIYSYHYRGIIQFLQNRPDEAIEDFTRVIQADSREYEAYYYRGMNFGKKGDDKKALMDYSAAIEIRPDYSKAIEERARIYVETGEHEKALEDYRRVLELNPNSVSLLEKKKLVEQALEDSFDSGRKLNLGNVYYMSGLAKISIGNYAGALDDYSKAIKIDPKNSNAYYYRSLVKLKLSETEGSVMKMSALADQEKSLSINPQDAKTSFFSAITRNAISQNNDFVLPGMNERYAWAEFYGISHPAEELGGDYFYFYADPKEDSTRFSFTIGDVSGKGTKAALFASIALQLKDEVRKKEKTSSAVIDYVNKFLVGKTGGISRKSRNKMYVTSIFASLHKNANVRMDWTNAGHIKPILLRKGKFSDLNFPITPPINCDDKITYDSQEEILQSGDSIYFFTDGLFEEKTADNSSVMEEIKMWILMNQFLGIKDLTESIISVSKALSENGFQSDDTTLAVIRIL